jgi:putative ABC transport system permease protein
MAIPSIRAGLETLRANPMRTLLSTLGVIMGSASLVAVLSLGDGAEAFARLRIQQEGYNHIVLDPITSDSVDGQRIARASIVVLEPADAEALAPVVGSRATGGLSAQGSLLWTPPGAVGAEAVAGAEVKAEARTAPGAGAGTTTGATSAITNGGEGKPRGLRVVALSPIGDALTTVAPIVAGRALTAVEARTGAAVCVVSQRLATLIADANAGAAAGAAAGVGASAGSGAGAVAATGVAVGANAGDATAARALDRTMSVDGHDWRIVGIQQDIVGDKGFTVVVPFASGLQVLRAPTRRIVLETKNLEDVRALTDDVGRWVEARAGWRGAMRVAATGQQRLEEIERTFLWLKMLMGAFTAIALVVGGIGIMNVLLASVIERTREIGIRKALGARRRDIRTQFLTESVAIATAGSLLGLLIGLSSAFGMTALMRARTAVPIYAGVSWSTLAASATAALLVGLIFGTYPALRASRLSPIDAIQRE